MSDWFGTHSTRPAAEAGLDLETPGPSAWLGPTLPLLCARARRPVRLDGQVRHMLQLTERVRMLDGTDPARTRAQEDGPEHRAAARAVAAEGTVLLVNDGLLPDPWTPPCRRRFEDTGRLEHRCHRPQCRRDGDGRRQLGGDARSAGGVGRGPCRAPARGRPCPDEVGCRIDRGLPALDMALMTTGDETASFTLEYFDSTGSRGRSSPRRGGRLSRVMWLGQLREDLTVGSLLDPAQRYLHSRPFGPMASRARESPVARCCASTARSSSTTPNRSAAKASTERGARWYRSSAPSNEVGPMPCRSTSGPFGRRVDHGRAHRRLAARRQRRVRACGARPPEPLTLPSWWARLQQPVGVRGAGPAGSLPARTPARTGRAVIEAESTDRGRGERGLPVEMPGRRRAGAVLLPGTAAKKQPTPGRHHRGGGRAERPAARSPSRHGRRTADRQAHVAALSGGRRARSSYDEGILVGYRFYDDEGCHSVLRVRARTVRWRHRVRRHRGGARRCRRRARQQRHEAGNRGVQVYVRALDPLVEGPDRELAAFAKVTRRRQRARDDRGRRSMQPPIVTGTSTGTPGGPTKVATRSWSVPRRVISADFGDSEPGRCDGRGRAVTGDEAARARRHRNRGHGHGTDSSSSFDDRRRSRNIRMRRGGAVAAACVGAFMGQLDASIVSVASPTLSSRRSTRWSAP